MKKEEDLLKSTDVAYILDMSPTDVTVLAQKGELRGEKRGRFWGFREADVMAYRRRVEKERMTARLSPFA